MRKAVIIVARNEGEWTKKTANSFKKVMPDAEVIGIDDGGYNDWPEYVRVHKLEIPIGVGQSRRLGVEVSNADLIVVTDGHVLYDSGYVEKAWELAAKGYIVNPSTKSIDSGSLHGNGRTHNIPDHKTSYVKTFEGEEVGLIGSVYFMSKEVALDVIAPSPAHGYNEHIMTCSAFCFGHRIYAFPSLVFAHLYKKAFNYHLTYNEQERNKTLMNYWFFDGKEPKALRDVERQHYEFVQKNRQLSVEELTDKFISMNERILKQHEAIKNKKKDANTIVIS